MLTPETPQGKKYTARDNAGKVLIRHGNPVNAGFWSNTASDFYQPDIKAYDKQNRSFKHDYRFMFERLREKAGFLDEIICRISDVMIQKDGQQEDPPMGFGPPMNDPFSCSGRIC